MTIPQPSPEMIAFYERRTDPNDMSDVDLIEMVCDWTAMAQEFGQGGGSARSWADRTIGKRLPLSEDRRQFVYRTIELLDTQLSGREGASGWGKHPEE